MASFEVTAPCAAFPVPLPEALLLRATLLLIGP